MTDIELRIRAQISNIQGIVEKANNVSGSASEDLNGSIDTLIDGHWTRNNTIRNLLKGDSFPVTRDFFEGVRSKIPSYFFSGSNITSVDIPGPYDILTETSVFENCKMLEEVRVGEGVTIFGWNYIFRGCTNLKRLYLPSTLASTGYQSFTNQNRLVRKHVYFAGTMDQWCKIKFGNGRQGNPCSDNGVLYINNEAVTDAVIPDTVDDLTNGGQFANMPLLKTVRFTKKIEVAAATFYADTAITDIYMPWSQGEVAGAPWGATNATMHYNWMG